MWSMGTFSVQMVMRGRFYCVVNIKSYIYNTVEPPPHHHLHAKSAHDVEFPCLFGDLGQVEMSI